MFKNRPTPLSRHYFYPDRFFFLLTFLCWVITVISRVRYQGLIYGFDYGIYQPDGANYTYRTLIFLSQTPMESATHVSNWYAIHGFKHNEISPISLIPETNPAWHLSAPRVLYPILSMPFVALLGIPGMLVIPSLSLLGLVYIHYKIGAHLGRPGLALLFNLFVLSSSTVQRWFIADLTDGLLAFLVGLLILLELRTKITWLWIVFATTIILLASATRFCAPIFISLGIGYLIQGKKLKALTLMLAGSFGALPLLFFSSSQAILPASAEVSLLSKIIKIPIQSMKVLLVEFTELLILDRIFFFVVVGSLFLAFRASKEIRISTFSILIGVFLVGFINGTLGVNFRYQLPLIPFLGWAFIFSLNLFFVSRRQLNIVGEKA